MGARDATTGAEPELVLDARADLGEGPTWDVGTRRLVWVDITRGTVHRFDPETRADEAFDVGRPVGAAAPTSSGKLVLATSGGFSLLDPETGAIRSIADVEADDERTSMNDGKCDPARRFWAGTKDLEGSRPLGSLYRLDPDGRVTRVVRDVTISNGLGWSLDRRTMYYIDSPTYGIDAFDFDLDTGDVSNRRRFMDVPNAWGLPDGMTVDEEGFLWVAFWGGSAVRRIAPDGRVVTVVEFPVSQTSSCAFGGEDLRDLYVTSAREGLSSTRMDAEPRAGGLFRVRVEVPGRPADPYAG